MVQNGGQQFLNNVRNSLPTPAGSTSESSDQPPALESADKMEVESDKTTEKTPLITNAEPISKPTEETKSEVVTDVRYLPSFPLH